MGGSALGEGVAGFCGSAAFGASAFGASAALGASPFGAAFAAVADYKRSTVCLLSQ